MTQTLFQMMDQHRQHLIQGHEFYIEQAQKRLLSQFDNIEAEATKYSEQWLDRASYHFDPDRHDAADLHHQAYEEV